MKWHKKSTSENIDVTGPLGLLFKFMESTYMQYNFYNKSNEEKYGERRLSIGN